jgi:serine/threonine protein kinase
VDLSSVDERVVRELLELLDRLGDRAGAIHAYEEFARRLSSDYGAEPAVETKALVERIRARPAALPARSDTVRRPEYRPNDQASASSASRPNLVGMDLNGWRIEREIGRGGTATVYLARDAKHGRNVALKALQIELSLSIGVERFLREIQIMAQLAHPHILPLIDSGAADGVLYLVTPYIPGDSLRERLRRERRLPIEESLTITRHVAAALDYAHRHGVIHRDVKPENILLHDAQALIADFGVARALHAAGGSAASAGIAPGTPSYMSPEQAAGESLDARSDVLPRHGVVRDAHGRSAAYGARHRVTDREAADRARAPSSIAPARRFSCDQPRNRAGTREITRGAILEHGGVRTRADRPRLGRERESC